MCFRGSARIIGRGRVEIATALDALGRLTIEWSEHGFGGNVGGVVQIDAIALVGIVVASGPDGINLCEKLRALPGRQNERDCFEEMVDVLAAPQQAKTDASLRTLAAISTAHWVSHFHLFVLPMLFPFLKEQLGVGYIELGFALTVFAVSNVDYAVVQATVLDGLTTREAAHRRGTTALLPQSRLCPPA